ncbi:MAG: hypothetical protein EBZ48_11530, partial [Proteobacteria bacterium]|nr:hypothetical protein [Pseudomonadota bacterium]
MILETAALSYHLSQLRLFARLLSDPAEGRGLDLGRIFTVPGVQQVLSRERVCLSCRGVSADLEADLRQVAHVHNAALGSSFVVVRSGDTLHLFNDGALRCLLAEHRAELHDPPGRSAREWSESELARFLAEMSKKNPAIEALVRSASPRDRLSTVPARLERAPAQYVNEIVIPTANRAEEVRRVLRSVAKSVEFYGYPPESLRVRVVDTSTTEAQRQDTQRAVALARKSGLSVEYQGPREIRAKLLSIRARLPEPAQRAFSEVFLRGLFAEGEQTGPALTIGTIRNAIALTLGDAPYISVDDDMMLHAPILPSKEYSKAVERSRARDVTYDLNTDTIN